jgi:hypothetical protein
MQVFLGIAAIDGWGHGRNPCNHGRCQENLRVCPALAGRLAV